METKESEEAQQRKHEEVACGLSKVHFRALFFGVLFFLTCVGIGLIWSVKSQLRLLTSKAVMDSSVMKMPLSMLSTMPLEEVDKFDTITLRWGERGSIEERSFLFVVKGAFRDGLTGETTLQLSADHILVAEAKTATLFDGNNEEVGVLNFEKLMEADLNTSSPNVRKLGPSYSNYRPGSATFFDAYCRYGCGNMALTFPYYNRPFFGYGYPLVGMENAFPAGYGGNPVTQLAANGIVGVPANQQLSSALGAAGVA